MKIALIVIGTIVALIVAFVAWRYIVFSRFEAVDDFSPEEHLRRNVDLVMGKKE
jgi:hypothetical protein